MADYGKTLKFRQSKGPNSSIANDTLMKLHKHNHTMFIYIQYNFHEIAFLGYLVMAQDGKKIIEKAIKGQLRYKWRHPDKTPCA